MAKQENKCSFCGRSEKEVNLLIAGQTGYICDTCAEQAYLITEEAFGKEKETEFCSGFHSKRFASATTN